MTHPSSCLRPAARRRAALRIAAAVVAAAAAAPAAQADHIVDASDFLVWRKAMTLGPSQSLRLCVPGAVSRAHGDDRFGRVKVQFHTDAGTPVLAREIAVPVAGAGCIEVAAVELATAGVGALPSGQFLFAFTLSVPASRESRAVSLDTLSAGEVVSRIAMLLPAIQSARPAQ